MAPLSQKSTKAELLEAYEAALAELEYYKSGNVTWSQVQLFLADRAQCISKECQWLVRDLKAATTVAVQWISVVLDTYRQPVLRSKA